jgi:hypothetical protein
LTSCPLVEYGKLFLQVYFVSEKENPEWRVVVEVDARSRRIYGGSADANEDMQPGAEDAIDVDREPAPAPPPPTGEAIPLEQVHAVDAQMEDPNDTRHMDDNDYPDVDDDEEPEEIDDVQILPF